MSIVRAQRGLGKKGLEKAAMRLQQMLGIQDTGLLSSGWNPHCLIDVL
jgi:hypothetical protein